MGLLDSILSGIAGGALARSGMGGLGGRRSNILLALLPEALSQAFDDNELSQIASEAGVSKDEARAGLAELLPTVVDQLTPQGQLPAADQFLAGIDQFERELQQRTG